MTQDEIIEMAKQAGAVYSNDHAVSLLDDEIIAFAKLVAAKERLDCFDAAYQAYATSEVLKAIRARGERDL